MLGSPSLDVVGIDSAYIVSGQLANKVANSQFNYEQAYTLRKTPVKTPPILSYPRIQSLGTNLWERPLRPCPCPKESPCWAGDKKSVQQVDGYGPSIACHPMESLEGYNEGMK